MRTITLRSRDESFMMISNETSRFQFRPIQADVYRALIRFFMEVQFNATRLAEAVDTRCDNPRKGDSASFLLCLSLLADLANWGTEFEFYESQLHVAIPHIGPKSTSPEVREKIRNSLLRLKDEATSFAQVLTESEAVEFVRDSRIELTPAESPDDEISSTFRHGVSTWSMPYRTREGRSQRFAVRGEVRNRVATLGILEIGDDAPHNPPRDRAMGFHDKFKDFTSSELNRLADRFQGIRACLLQDGLPDDFAGPVEDLISRAADFRARGRGRQGSLKEISANKRLTYLFRLVSAEAACRFQSNEDERGFAEGLRVLRDLTIPRVNVELVICGALPPFGKFRVGKLVASMAGHPHVRAFVDRDFGVIAKSVFDTERLKLELPSVGALIVTTKGLYPGHSSQYNGVRLPGRSTMLKMRKLGDTDGKTTSHLSDRTMRLATRTITELNGEEISRTFGAGGAKRQRTITQAVRLLGLSSEICFAHVSRPVYGVTLVNNLKRVVLFNERPEWLATPFERAEIGEIEAFERDTVAMWRTRWLERNDQFHGG